MKPQTSAPGAAPVDDIAARAALADAGLVAPPGATATQAGTPEQQADQAKADQVGAAAAEARGYLDALVAMATEAEIHKVAELLPPERREKIARAFGAVAVKRGWTMGDVFARWKEEAELVEACMPLLVYGGMLAWDALKKKNAPALRAPDPVAPAVDPKPAAPEKRRATFEINGVPV